MDETKRCRHCGVYFTPKKGSAGKYCSKECSNNAKRGWKIDEGNFVNLGVGPRRKLISLNTGSWESRNL